MFLSRNRNNGVKYHSVIILCARLCIAQQNLSIGVNVVSRGSPSRMRSVRRISLGITIRPKSSTLLTIPVAFIYLSPFLVGTPLLRCPWTPEDGCPYNNFTNYDACICKQAKIIPQPKEKLLCKRGVFVRYYFPETLNRLSELLHFGQLPSYGPECPQLPHQ